MGGRGQTHPETQKAKRDLSTLISRPLRHHHLKVLSFGNIPWRSQTFVTLTKLRCIHCHTPLVATLTGIPTLKKSLSSRILILRCVAGKTSGTDWEAWSKCYAAPPSPAPSPRLAVSLFVPANAPRPVGGIRAGHAYASISLLSCAAAPRPVAVGGNCYTNAHTSKKLQKHFVHFCAAELFSEAKMKVGAKFAILTARSPDTGFTLWWRVAGVE